MNLGSGFVCGWVMFERSGFRFFFYGNCFDWFGISSFAFFILVFFIEYGGGLENRKEIGLFILEGGREVVSLGSFLKRSVLYLDFYFLRRLI